MDNASESVVFGLTGGLGAGLVVGLFTGVVMTCVLAGAICGILLGSFVDLPVLLGTGANARTTGRDDDHRREKDANSHHSDARRAEVHGSTAAPRGGRERRGR